MQNRAKETNTAQIYIKALDGILTAMKGKRIFERFGFNLTKAQGKQRPDAKLLSNFKEWEFCPEKADWVNMTTQEVLTDFEPPSYLQAILSENLNDTIF